MQRSAPERRGISKGRGKKRRRYTRSWKRENRALCKEPKKKMESPGNGRNVKWSRNSCSLHFTFVISFSFHHLRSLSCLGFNSTHRFPACFHLFFFSFFFGWPYCLCSCTHYADDIVDKNRKNKNTSAIVPHTHTLAYATFTIFFEPGEEEKKNVAKRGNLPELKQIEKVCHNHNAKVKSF